MQTMKDLDYGNLGDKKKIVLEDDLLLDDSGFSNKPPALAKKGETVIVWHCPNYGIVKHAIHGSFRY